MSATDKFQSIDETLAFIKETHAAEMAALADALKAATVELELTKAAFKKADERAMVSERLAIKLITQFGTVEAIFAEAKKLALQVDSMVARDEEGRIDPSPFAPKQEITMVHRALGENRL
jgi:hypothetical protein